MFIMTLDIFHPDKNNNRIFLHTNNNCKFATQHNNNTNAAVWQISNIVCLLKLELKCSGLKKETKHQLIALWFTSHQYHGVNKKRTIRSLFRSIKFILYSIHIHFLSPLTVSTLSSLTFSISFHYSFPDDEADTFKDDHIWSHHFNLFG